MVLILWHILSALSFILDGLKKPVIFTGSQIPIGSRRTDAKENLITSIENEPERYKKFAFILKIITQRKQNCKSKHRTI